MKIGLKYPIPASGIKGIEKSILESSDGHGPVRRDRESQLRIAHVEILEQLDLQPLSILTGRTGEVCVA